MFTGLVTHTARVKAVSTNEDGGLSLRLENPFESRDRVIPGESIAIDGCCLTVLSDAHDYQDSLEFFVSAETLQRTALRQIEVGARVNLERSLKVGERFGGHQVSGHIDAPGRIGRVECEGETSLIEIGYPARFARLLVEKGSVSVSGVSLTVNTLCDEIDDSGMRRFGVMVIPHTLENTTLGKLSVGDEVNLEFDLAAKYALRSGELENATGDLKVNEIIRSEAQLDAK